MTEKQYFKNNSFDSKKIQKSRMKQKMISCTLAI